MISKETFLKTIESHRKYNEIVDNLSELLKAPILYEANIISIPFEWFDTILETNFSEEGIDWINWYLYDRPKDNPTVTLADGQTIDIDTDEKLWEFVRYYGIV